MSVEKLSDLLKDHARSALSLHEELDDWIGAHDAYRCAGVLNHPDPRWLAKEPAPRVERLAVA